MKEEKKMKLSITQKKLYDKLVSTVKVLEKYQSYEDFFDNSKDEQNTFTTAYHCNSYYNSSERYQQNDPQVWEEKKQSFYKARDEHILIVFAKTETLKALEKVGLIEIIEHAKHKGGCETVKII